MGGRNDGMMGDGVVGCGSWVNTHGLLRVKDAISNL